jgi:hypothetical protein
MEFHMLCCNYSLITAKLNYLTFLKATIFLHSQKLLIYTEKGKKFKAIPVTSCGGLQDCETSRLPHVLDNGLTDGVEVVTLRRSLPPRRFISKVASILEILPYNISGILIV